MSDIYWRNCSWMDNADKVGEGWYLAGDDNYHILQQGGIFWVREDNAVSEPGKPIAGPFDSLDAAKAAYLLIKQ